MLSLLCIMDTQLHWDLTHDVKSQASGMLHNSSEAENICVNSLNQ